MIQMAMKMNLQDSKYDYAVIMYLYSYHDMLVHIDLLILH